jgi:hypothetical protein
LTGRGWAIKDSAALIAARARDNGAGHPAIRAGDYGQTDSFSDGCGDAACATWRASREEIKKVHNPDLLSYGALASSF